MLCPLRHFYFVPLTLLHQRFSSFLKYLNMNYFYRWPGRAHDARVWLNSQLCHELSDLCYVGNQRLDETFHIIGDSAYPLSNHLICPYRSTRLTQLDGTKKKFNTHLASKRSVIERAFGLLGLRFPRLLKITAQSNYKRIKIVVSACVLHNWCILEDDADEEAFEEAIIQSLRHDVSDGKPAAAIVGRRRACGGGNTKRNLIKALIARMQ